MMISRATLLVLSTSLPLVHSCSLGSDEGGPCSGKCDSSRIEKPELVRCWLEPAAAGSDLFCQIAATDELPLELMNAKVVAGGTERFLALESTDKELVTNVATFPVEVAVSAVATSSIVGVTTDDGFLDIASTFTVHESGGATTTAPLALRLPFDLWPVTFVGEVDIFEADLEPYTLPLESTTADGASTLNVSGRVGLVKKGETMTLYFAADSTTAAITGMGKFSQKGTLFEAGAEAMLPISLKAGDAFRTTMEGLVPTERRGPRDTPRVALASQRDGWHSLAIDSTGAPHLAIYGRDGGFRLEHAWLEGGAWMTEAVTVSEGSGIFNHLSFGVDDQPVVVYKHQDAPSVGLAVGSTGGFEVSTLPVTGSLVAFAADASGTPHIVIEQANGQLDFGAWSGSNFDLETIDDSAPVIVSASTTQLRFDPSGDPHVVYKRQRADGVIELVHATRNGSSWTNESVAAIGMQADPENDIAGAFDFAIASDGTAHVAFVDATTSGAGELKHASRGGASWSERTVDSDGADRIAMAVAPSGAVTVVYFQGDELRAAVDRGATWERTTLDAQPAGDARAFYLAGPRPQAAADASGKVHIAYYTWDGEPDSFSLRYLTL